MTNRMFEQSVETFIDSQYKVKDRDEVFSFLNENPALGDLLIEAHEHIRRYFPTSLCRLELYSDPEYDHQELMILIESQLDVDEAMGKLSQFDQDWWLDNIHKAETKLHFGLDYI